MIRLCWRHMQVLDARLPADCLGRGEHKRLVMPRRHQYAWLQHLFPEQMSSGKAAWQMWLETDTASVQAGSTMFVQSVASMLHRRGVMANLSLRENLLLHFLHHGDQQALMQAEQDLPEVAAFLGIADALDEQAGERSPYTHGIVSLGRCLLQKPDIIVAQDVHSGMPPHRLQRFCAMFGEALSRLQAGLLYLSTSVYDGSGVDFEHSLELDIGIADGGRL